MKKKTILTILLALIAMAGLGKVKPKVLTTLQAYPSGVIDEYHFHAGTVVVQGRFMGGKKRDFSTFNVKGTDLFSNQDFVRTICIEPDGSFLEQISLPHSGWVYFDGADIPPAFIAVGDTLGIWVDYARGEATISGSGATGEVNSIWPRLKNQFASKEIRTPWESLGRKFMLEWKKHKVRDLDQIAMAIDADTITALKGLVKLCKGCVEDQPAGHAAGANAYSRAAMVMEDKERGRQGQSCLNDFRWFLLRLPLGQTILSDGQPIDGFCS